jgi:hypothetical protein
MKIFINNHINNKLYTVVVENKTTIREIKQEIQKQEKTIKNPRFIYQAQDLEDLKTVFDYKLNDGTTIHLVLNVNLTENQKKKMREENLSSMENVEIEPPLKKQRVKRGKYAKKACLNCRKAHSACDSGRPCKRCVSFGLQHECRDIERKKTKKKVAKPNKNFKQSFNENEKDLEDLKFLVQNLPDYENENNKKEIKVEFKEENNDNYNINNNNIENNEDIIGNILNDNNENIKTEEEIENEKIFNFFQNNSDQTEYFPQSFFYNEKKENNQNNFNFENFNEQNNLDFDSSNNLQNQIQQNQIQQNKKIKK